MLDWICNKTFPSEKGDYKKVVSHFMTYILQNYPEIKYIHSMSLKGNASAEALLYSVGFRKDETERLSKKHNFFLKEKN